MVKKSSRKSHKKLPVKSHKKSAKKLKASGPPLKVNDCNEEEFYNEGYEDAYGDWIKVSGLPENRTELEEAMEQKLPFGDYPNILRILSNDNIFMRKKNEELEDLKKQLELIQRDFNLLSQGIELQRNVAYQNGFDDCETRLRNGQVERSRTRRRTRRRHN